MKFFASREPQHISTGTPGQILEYQVKFYNLRQRWMHDPNSCDYYMRRLKEEVRGLIKINQRVQYTRANANPKYKEIRKQIGHYLGQLIAKARKLDNYNDIGPIAAEMLSFLYQIDIHPSWLQYSDLARELRLARDHTFESVYRNTMLSAYNEFYSVRGLERFVDKPDDPQTGEQKLACLLHAIVRDLARISNTTWQVPGYTSFTHLPGLGCKELLLHVPHVAEGSKLQVAYTQSWEKKVRDIQTVTKPGRYYAKFTTEDIANELAQQHNGMYGEKKLFFKESDDPEGWMFVYRHGPNSCMSSEPWKIEPYALAGNGLRLAYLTRDNNPDSSSINARCIVRDDHDKGYVRIYGDAHTMMPLLQEAGYGDCINLHGIKIAKIDHPGRSGWVFPYIDQGNDGSQCVDIMRDHLLICEDGDITCTNTDGTGDGCNSDEDEGNTWYCETCDDSYDEGDESPTYVSGHGSVCEYCLDNHFTRLQDRQGRMRYFHNDEVTQAVDGPYSTCEVPDDDLDYRSDVIHLDWDYDGIWYAMEDHAAHTPEGWICLHSDDCVELDREFDGCAYAHRRYTQQLDGRYYHEDDDISDLLPAEEETTEQATEE